MAWIYEMEATPLRKNCRTKGPKCLFLVDWLGDGLSLAAVLINACAGRGNNTYLPLRPSEKINSEPS